jgi:hypothetical protein
MYAWRNIASKRRHLADNFEMTTYCGRAINSPSGPGRPIRKRWESLGQVAAHSLGNPRRVPPDLCLKCAMLAQPFYFERPVRRFTHAERLDRARNG